MGSCKARRKASVREERLGEVIGAKADVPCRVVLDTGLRGQIPEVGRHSREDLIGFAPGEASALPCETLDRCHPCLELGRHARLFEVGSVAVVGAFVIGVFQAPSRFLLRVRRAVGFLQQDGGGAEGARIMVRVELR